jgi:formylglycine-generating enzyme required for sulfatase activity
MRTEDDPTTKAQRVAQNLMEGQGKAEAPGAKQEERKLPEPSAERADPTKAKTFTNSVGMKMVLIPAGEFSMGSPPTERGRWKDEGPVHKVGLDAFYVSQTEVTQRQWEAVMGNNPSNFKGDPNLPVENVSWNDAQKFIARLNQKEGTDTYRLPTEAEWEYACRAGSQERFCYGDSERKVTHYAWYRGNAGNKTNPVAQKNPNSWGFYDMHGNVWEWVTDRYNPSYYTNSPPKNPTGPANGKSRVVRGGAWNLRRRYLRCATRNWAPPDGWNGKMGFRLAKAVP